MKEIISPFLDNTIEIITTIPNTAIIDGPAGGLNGDADKVEPIIPLNAPMMDERIITRLYELDICLAAMPGPISSPAYIITPIISTLTIVMVASKNKNINSMYFIGSPIDFA